MIEAKEIGRVTRSCERRETVGEGSVSYRLIKVEADFSLYLLLVSDDEEEVAIIAGKEEESARKLLDAFADGKVSPTTANDIFRDIILQ